MAKPWKKPLIVTLPAGFGLALGLGIRPAHHLWNAHATDIRSVMRQPRDSANDISGLNSTAMHTVAIAADSAVAQLQKSRSAAQSGHPRRSVVEANGTVAGFQRHGLGDLFCGWQSVLPRLAVK